MMFQRIELYNEPCAIINKMEEGYCEMTLPEQGFLCGLIRNFLPKKVVEIGVAGGGTTSVVMNCLNLLKSNAKMFSIDLNEECYRRYGKKSGYQLEEVKEDLSNYENHTFLLGQTLPHVIEKIGGDIDFVILDTVHVLPGEILDFLCILPYLKDGAVVVLHDVTLNLGTNEKAFCNKILLDASIGEKYFDFEHGNINIGAIRITEGTRRNIANVFSTFSITWEYLPPISEIKAYREKYLKYYDEECISLFDLFVRAQYKRMKQIKRKKSLVITLKERVRKSEKLYGLICKMRGK